MSQKGYLDFDDIRNFSCVDLRVIDQLWVRYSDGHFGFSVQKEIYLSCGGKADYKYYDEAFTMFVGEVGWREKNDSWRVRYDLPQSPRGHLPWIVMKGEVSLYWGCFFSRIQACEL